LVQAAKIFCNRERTQQTANKNGIDNLYDCLFSAAFSEAKFEAIPDDGVNVPPYYNLDVILDPTNSGHEINKAEGLIKFRQNPAQQE